MAKAPGHQDAHSIMASDATKATGAKTVSTQKQASFDSVPALHSYQITPTLKDKYSYMLFKIIPKINSVILGLKEIL